MGNPNTFPTDPTDPQNEVPELTEKLAFDSLDKCLDELDREKPGLKASLKKTDENGVPYYLLTNASEEGGGSGVGFMIVSPNGIFSGKFPYWDDLDNEKEIGNRLRKAHIPDISLISRHIKKGGITNLNDKLFRVEVIGMEPYEYGGKGCNIMQHDLTKKKGRENVGDYINYFFQEELTRFKSSSENNPN